MLHVNCNILWIFFDLTKSIFLFSLVVSLILTIIWLYRRPAADAPAVESRPQMLQPKTLLGIGFVVLFASMAIDCSIRDSYNIIIPECYGRNDFWFSVISNILQILAAAIIAFGGKDSSSAIAKVGACAFSLAALFGITNSLVSVSPDHSLLGNDMAYHIYKYVFYWPGALLLVWGTKLWTPVKISLTAYALLIAIEHLVRIQIDHLYWFSPHIARYYVIYGIVYAMAILCIAACLILTIVAWLGNKSSAEPEPLLADVETNYDDYKEHNRCLECGHDNPVQARFCRHCGQQLPEYGVMYDDGLLRQRPGCVSAFLWLGVVANAISAFAQLISLLLGDGLTSAIKLFSSAGVIFGFVSLLKWKKSGFYLILLFSVLSLVMNMKDQPLTPLSFSPIASILILFIVLQCGRHGKSCWDSLS